MFGHRPTQLPFDWYRRGMRTTIDQAGRLVIPKSIRDLVGLVPGEVEIVVYGAHIEIAPLWTDELVERDGHLFLADPGLPLTDDDVRDLRHAHQK